MVHWFMAPLPHCRGAKILQTTRLPEKRTEAKELRPAGQTVNNYYTLAVEAQAPAMCIDVCARTDVFTLFYMKASPIERQKGVRRKETNKKLGHTVRTFKCFPTISGLVQQSVGETVTG